MLKRVTILVILIVFAKPAYDFTMNFLEQPTVSDQMEITQRIPVVTEPLQTVEVIEKEEVSLPKWVDTEEDLADAFYYYFSRYETEFTIQYVGSTKDIERFLTQAIDQAVARDDFMGGHLANREMVYEYSKLDAKIKVTQSYLMDAVQAQQTEQQVNAIISATGVQALSDYEKIKFVNDYIVKNTVYSTQTVTSPHSAYTVAFEGKGVCQGYALLAQKMFQQLGIEAQYVVGEVDGEGHAWNLVQLDGQWYHLDVTWNDPLPDRGNEVRYGYFLVSDTHLARDHTWIMADYPSATNEQYAAMNER